MSYHQYVYGIIFSNVQIITGLPNIAAKIPEVEWNSKASKKSMTPDAHCKFAHFDKTIYHFGFETG